MNHPQELYGLEEFLGKGSRSGLKRKKISFYKATTEWEDEELVDSEGYGNSSSTVEYSHSRELH